MKNNKKAFTLVELLVVIAILAILATVSIVGYSSFTKNAKDSVALQEATQLRDAMIAEDINNGLWAIDATAGVTGNVTDASDDTADFTACLNGFAAEMGGSAVYADGVVTYTTNASKGASQATWNVKTGKVENK